MDQSLSKLEQFLSAFREAVAAGTLVRATLRMPTKESGGLTGVDIRPVALKSGLKLGFVLHTKTQDRQENLDADAAVDRVGAWLAVGFRQGFVFATDGDVSYDAQGKGPKLKRAAPSSKAGPVLGHDREKHRPVPADRPWLQALGVTDDKGEVLKSAGDKFRQINRYVELLAPVLESLPAGKVPKIVDMGAGKGYLTFAVADYAARELGRDAQVVGVEFRRDLTELCNRVAGAAGLDGLSFVPGTIADHDATGADVLIALHACDTATDDAIGKGIAAGARAIVVAPCCHKQIRREMEAANIESPLEFATRHGIFLERQAEMVTDAMRVLVLEHFGYEVKAVEFISDQHTPKNVMLIATKRGLGDKRALEKFRAAKAVFGIRKHYLETVTGLG